jgi:hypothetical protein
MSGIPAVGLDPDDYEPAGRSRRGRTEAGASRKKQVDEADIFVRMTLNLRGPIVPADRAGLGSATFPDWAVRRAVMRLVKEGVLRGPAPAPKTAGGKPVWYHYISRYGDSVVWAEGAWRRTYFHFPSDRSIRAVANEPRKTARKNNREAPSENAWQTRQTRAAGVFHGVHPSRNRKLERPMPSMSMRARVREFFRRLPAVDWDGMAYFPVPGPALDAVLAWRGSRSTAGGTERPPAKLELPEEERKTCRRCGASFPKRWWHGKRNHELKECNLLLAKRIMEE